MASLLKLAVAMQEERSRLGSSDGGEPTDTAKVPLMQVDFAQAFHQLRAYDDQSIRVFQITVGAQISLLTALAALFVAFSRDTHPLSNIVFAVFSVVLFLGFVAGLLSLVFLVRNRIFFVIMARYINQYRSFVHSGKPLGFQDRIGIWSSPDYPPFFEWHATHVLLIYGVAFFNGVFLTGSVLLLLLAWTPLEFSSSFLLYAVFGVVFAFLLQIVPTFLFINRREGLTAEGRPLPKTTEEPANAAPG